jgi:hypothetical protein
VREHHGTQWDDDLGEYSWSQKGIQPSHHVQAILDSDASYRALSAVLDGPDITARIPLHNLEQIVFEQRLFARDLSRAETLAPQILYRIQYFEHASEFGRSPRPRLQPSDANSNRLATPTMDPLCSQDNSLLTACRSTHRAKCMRRLVDTLPEG